MDLVERQKVIDAIIVEYNTEDSDYPTDYQLGLAKAKQIIAEMPSAQPESHDKCTETHDVSFEKQRIVTGPLGELWKKWAKEKDDYSLREYKLKLAYSAGFEDGLRAKREEKEDEQND